MAEGAAQDAFLRIEGVSKSFGSFQSDRRQGRDLLALGRVGLRQDHAVADAGRL